MLTAGQINKLRGIVLFCYQFFELTKKLYIIW